MSKSQSLAPSSKKTAQNEQLESSQSNFVSLEEISLDNPTSVEPLAKPTANLAIDSLQATTFQPQSSPDKKGLHISISTPRLPNAFSHRKGGANSKQYATLEDTTPPESLKRNMLSPLAGTPTPSTTAQGIIEKAANIVMDLGKSVANTPRLSNMHVRRDNFDEPLLFTTSQTSITGGAIVNESCTDTQGEAAIIHPSQLRSSILASTRQATNMPAVGSTEVARKAQTIEFCTYPMESDLGTGFSAHFAVDANDREGSDIYKPRRNYPCNHSISSQRSSSSMRGSVITFSGIMYAVNTKKYLWSKSIKKHILRGISGIMRPGMNAIMGPTGSGKSSLLDVLAGRKDPKYLTGKVLIDGVAQPENFKCHSGYVVQDDIVMGTLTVRENLHFSAALRLPSTWSSMERNQKVNDIINELGLTKVADSKIGTELIRGVSGGERKRANIGIELITDPTVLFLDEPTTGLDSYTAGSVIKTLRTLAMRGRTIIFSLHQPKYYIYKMFDTLTLVVNGNLIYHGAADSTSINYFKQMGYVCEQHNSPPDFFMDIIHGEAARVNQDGSITGDEVSLSGIEPPAECEHNMEIISEKLIEYWKNSPQNARILAEVDAICKVSDSKQGQVNEKSKRMKNHEYATGFFTQVKHVSRRTALNIFRSPQDSLIQLAVYLFFALSVGTVYVHLNLSTESGIQDRQGLFFFLVLQMTFVNLAAVDVFIKERAIFIHENSSGFYRVSVYFLAKLVCDMVPTKAMPVFFFMPCVYFMAGLRLDVGAFFYYELNLVLTTIAACGVAYFLSAMNSVFGIANIITSICFVFMMVFGGFLKNMASLGTWLSWCRYISIFYYSITALNVNEMKPLMFCPYTNITTEGNCAHTCISGDVYLSQQDLPHATDWDLWNNQLGLFIIFLVFMTACYIQLRLMNKYK